MLYDSDFSDQITITMHNKIVYDTHTQLYLNLVARMDLFEGSCEIFLCSMGLRDDNTFIEVMI